MGALRSDPRAASLQLLGDPQQGVRKQKTSFPYIWLFFGFCSLALCIPGGICVCLSTIMDCGCRGLKDFCPDCRGLKDCSPKSALITCVILACLFTLSVVLARAGVPKERDDEIRGSVSMRMNHTWTKIPDATYTHERSTPDPMLLWWQVMLCVALSCACSICCTYTVWHFSNRPNCTNADISESSDSTSEDSKDMEQ